MRIKGIAAIVSPVLFLHLFIGAQLRREIRIPDLKGFQTLVGDFHMHTLFSDGEVWPTTRVEEAYREGLDVIAITDHVETEYKDFREDVPVKYNRSYALALPRAQELGILLIKAAEITREMPPGHFNALFIRDETPLIEEDPIKAIGLAVGQGAFIVWNHPGWGKQLKEDGVVRWYQEHSQLLKKGWLHGIEVVNWDSYYPEAFDWALEKNLTLFGNSDSHSRIDFDFDPRLERRRPYTLVFAKERTLEGVRDALENRRTLVYYRKSVIGREEWLRPFFESCVEPVAREWSSNESGRVLIRVTNRSDIPVRMGLDNGSDIYTLTEEIGIPPQSTGILTLRFKEGAELGIHELHLPIVVLNFLKNPKESLRSIFKIKVENRTFARSNG